MAPVVLALVWLPPPLAAAQDAGIESGGAGCPERAVVRLNLKSVQLYGENGAPAAQVTDKDLASPLRILRCVKSNIFLVDYKGQKLFVFRHQVVADTKFNLPDCAKLSSRSETLQTAGAPAIVDGCKQASGR
jgi:hypothetical protein